MSFFLFVGPPFFLKIFFRGSSSCVFFFLLSLGGLPGVCRCFIYARKFFPCLVATLFIAAGRLLELVRIFLEFFLPCPFMGSRFFLFSERSSRLLARHFFSPGRPACQLFFLFSPRTGHPFSLRLSVLHHNVELSASELQLLDPLASCVPTGTA